MGSEVARIRERSKSRKLIEQLYEDSQRVYVVHYNCTRPDQPFAFDLTSTRRNDDRQRTTHCSQSRQATIGQEQPVDKIVTHDVSRFSCAAPAHFETI